MEETLAQIMQVSMSNHKSTELAIKNLEIQVGQLAKQLADNSSSTFGANTEKNLKEEYKAILTHSRKAVMFEDEEKIGDDKQQPVIEQGEEEKEEEEDQLKEKQINDKDREINVQEKEGKEKEKQKEKDKNEKNERK
ncbi:hypothetical protein GmHk_17G049810 [Glycine max]|nr:hypothetical protein GmHk_17G049810 [Glycine max]